MIEKIIIINIIIKVIFMVSFLRNGNIIKMYFSIVIMSIVSVDIKIGIANIGIMIWYKIVLND